MSFNRRYFLALSSLALVSLAGRAVQPADAARANKATPRTMITPELKSRIKAITNVFEVGRPEPDYTYVADLKDGRGFTATNYGFVTAEREVASVISTYAKSAPGSQLAAFLPRLPPRGDGTDTSALEGFPKAWRADASDRTAFAAACETVVDRIYFDPAMAAGRKYQVSSPIGQSILFDTILQHGDGNDPDGLRAILKRTRDLMGDAGPAGEDDFLYGLLEVRRDVLLRPDNNDTRNVWRKSVPRIDALQHLLADNPKLVAPVRVWNKEVDLVIT